MIHLGKRAAPSDALVVLCGVMAYDLRLFHLNAEMLPYKVNGRKDGEEGIPLAAAWTSDLTDRLKRFCRHFVGQCKRLIGQGRRLRNDGHKHPCADSRTASTPKAASAAGNAPSSIHHLRQCAAKLNVSACVVVCRQQCRSYHHMMLRTVHMTGGQRHHLFNDGDRISRCACQAQRNDAIKPSGMAFVAYIVSVHAARLAVFFLMANLTFHQNIGFEIGKWGFADQAFFIHNLLRTIPTFLFDKLEFIYNPSPSMMFTISS